MNASDESFCASCYSTSIERMCNGYSYAVKDGKQVRFVPALDADTAAGVRRAAAVMLAIHKNTATVAHLHTHGQRAIGSINFTPGVSS